MEVSSSPFDAELGMHLDANSELEEIAPEFYHLPEVLEIRLAIYGAVQKWELMQTVASALAKHDPDEVHSAVFWAYATRRANSIEVARGILLHALKWHPKEAILHYDLACYECQMGNIEEAKRRLTMAFELTPESRAVALDDRDLEPLWMALGQWRAPKAARA